MLTETLLLVFIGAAHLNEEWSHRLSSTSGRAGPGPPTALGTDLELTLIWNVFLAFGLEGELQPFVWLLLLA